MNAIMNDTSLNTLKQVSGLSGRHFDRGVFHCATVACYAWIEQILLRFEYARLGMADKGLPRPRWMRSPSPSAIIGAHHNPVRYDNYSCNGFVDRTWSNQPHPLQADFWIGKDAGCLVFHGGEPPLCHDPPQPIHMLVEAG